jgi:hypothetical protein
MDLDSLTVFFCLIKSAVNLMQLILYFFLIFSSWSSIGGSKHDLCLFLLIDFNLVMGHLFFHFLE